MRQDSLTPEDQMSDGSFREFSFEVQHRYLFSLQRSEMFIVSMLSLLLRAPEERNVLVGSPTHHTFRS